MFFQSLPWDGDFFGYRIMRIDITDDCTIDALQKALEQEYDACYIFSRNGTQETTSFLLSAGAVLYDHKVTFRKTLSENAAAQPDPRVRELRNSSREAVELAVSSGIHSRFYLDPHFRPKQPALYERWIANCFERENGKVFGISQDGVLAAVAGVTVSDGTGHLELIAVHSDFRRRGFARTLIQAAENFYLASGAATAEVVTQLDNAPACATYRACGYKQKDSADVWHLWKKSSEKSERES